MEKRKIGSLSVSIVGLGCNNFGWRLDEATTANVVSAALDAGINFLDTADIYGGTKSEEYLGRVLGKRRNEIVLATKFGMEVDPKRKGARPEYVKQACEDSLRRLRTDRIDLYQLHTPDKEVPIADTLGALNELVREGKVREIGCSNFEVEQLAEADELSKKKKIARFVSVQNNYSLIKRDPEKGVLAECEKRGIGFIPFFPLASGLLTGKYRKGSALPEGARLSEGERSKRMLTDENLELVEKLIQYAESKGHTILELAFGYLLAHRVVSSVIAGATSPEQARNNATAAKWILSAKELEEVKRLVG